MNSANSIFTTKVQPAFYVSHRCSWSITGRIWELMANRFIGLEVLYGNIWDPDENRFFFFSILILLLALMIQDRLLVEN